MIEGDLNTFEPESEVKSANSFGSQVGYFAMIASIFGLIGYFLGDEGALDMTWQLINALQILNFIPLMSLKFPLAMAKLFSYLEYANMENQLLNDSFKSMFLNEKEFGDEFNTPENDNYQRQGFESKAMLMNSADLF